MRALTRRALAIGAVLVVACDDNSTEPTPSLIISPTATAVTIQASRSALVSVSVVRAGARRGVVSMEVVDVPAGITATFLTNNLPSHSTLALLDVRVGISVQPGTYTIGVHANGEGLAEATCQFAVTVTAPPTFTLTIEPPTLAFRPGSPPVSALVTIVPANGFDSAVTFSIEGVAPAGGVVGLPYNPAAKESIRVTVADNYLSEEIPPLPGVYHLTIRGKCSGFPDQTVSLTVTILAP